MLIVTPSIARKRVSEESSAKGRETVSLWSIVIANKDVGVLNQQTIRVRSCLFSRKNASSNFSILSNEFHNAVYVIWKAHESLLSSHL